VGNGGYRITENFRRTLVLYLRTLGGSEVQGSFNFRPRNTGFEESNLALDMDKGFRFHTITNPTLEYVLQKVCNYSHPSFQSCGSA
jgi:hypothetical protein